MSSLCPDPARGLCDGHSDEAASGSPTSLRVLPLSNAQLWPGGRRVVRKPKHLSSAPRSSPCEPQQVWRITGCGRGLLGDFYMLTLSVHPLTLP